MFIGILLKFQKLKFMDQSKHHHSSMNTLLKRYVIKNSIIIPSKYIYQNATFMFVKEFVV